MDPFCGALDVGLYYSYTSRSQSLRNSPFGKLPNELIVEIFLASALIDYPTGIVSLDAFALQLPKLSKDTAPLKLCHICYPLRWLVLNCPLLWARFELQANTSPSKAQSEALVWTSRSRSCPLTFSLHLLKSRDINQWNIQMQSYTAILAVLSQHVDRWKHVRLVVPTEDTLKKALLPLRQASKGLSTLAICGTWPWPRLSSSLGEIIPEQVNQLHIQGFEFQLGRFDASRLRYIFYTLDVDISDLYWVLDACKSLQYLDIGVHENKVKPFSAPKPQVYANIQVLRIRNIGSTPVIGHLLDPLTMPNLIKLSLESSEAAEHILPSLANMMHRSFSGRHSPMQELEVNTGRWRGTIPPAFFELLENIPHLKKLVMCSAELTDDILHVLTLDCNDDGEIKCKKLCPGLETIHWSFSSRVTLDALTTMLGSRWTKQPANLSEVHLRYCMVKKIDLLKNPIIEYAVRTGAILKLV